MTVPPPAASRATAMHVVGWIALLIACSALYLRGVGSFQIGAFQDDAVYIVLARSIAFGDEFGLINQPPPRPLAKYPFGFPLALAPVVYWFPQSLLALTAVPIAATLLNISLLFWGWPLLAPTTSRWWGLAVAALYGLAPRVTAHARLVMSEPTFTTLVLSALLLIELRARRRAGQWAAAVVGAIVTLAMFTRTFGAALWPVAMVRLLRANGGRDLAGLAIGSVALLAAVCVMTPVQLTQIYPRGYVAELRQGYPGDEESTPQPRETMSEQVMRVAGGYIMSDIRGALLPFGGGDRERAVGRWLGIETGPEVVGVVVTAVTALGAWLSVTTGALAPAALLFEFAYGAIALIWIYDSARYLYPIQPLLCFQFLLGVWSLGAWIAGFRWPHAVAVRVGAGAVTMVASLLIISSAWKSLDTSDSRGYTRDLVADTSWIAANSDPNAIVMARYPASIHLYAHRQTVPLPEVHSAAQLDMALVDNRVDYILLGPKLTWASDGAFSYVVEDAGLPAIASAMAEAGRLELVYASDPQRKILVYKVNGNGARPSS